MTDKPHTCPSCQGDGSSLCFINRGSTAAHTAEADGDSMSGAIEHGDIMLVDLSKPESAPRQSVHGY